MQWEIPTLWQKTACELTAVASASEWALSSSASETVSGSMLLTFQVRKLLVTWRGAVHWRLFSGIPVPFPLGHSSIPCLQLCHSKISPDIAKSPLEDEYAPSGEPLCEWHPPETFPTAAPRGLDIGNINMKNVMILSSLVYRKLNLDQHKYFIIVSLNVIQLHEKKIRKFVNVFPLGNKHDS